MDKNNLLILSLLFFVIYSCNVQSIRKARLQNAADEQQSAQVDSFLYYKPVTLQDPFLDSLNVQHDTQQTVKIKVQPAPLPAAPKFKQVQGYRVQTFAGIDSLNALVMVNDLKNVFKDSVYFFKDENLYKIQLGDYPYRNDADMKVLDLRKDGIAGAWVVQRLINIPLKMDSTDHNITPLKDTKYPFKIQILVTSDENKAKSIADELKNQFNMESSYARHENLFKVFLGKFITREEAQKVLDNVRDNGFKDAWLVVEK